MPPTLYEVKAAGNTTVELTPSRDSALAIFNTLRCPRRVFELLPSGFKRLIAYSREFGA